MAEDAALWGHVKSIFKSADENGDGQISCAELKKFFNGRLEDREVELLLSEADTKKTGSLDIDEFFAWLSDDVDMLQVMNVETTANEKTARQVYELFGKGDLPGVGGLYADADNADVQIIFTYGLMQLKGWNDMVAKVVSRIGEHNPTFKPVDGPVLMQTSDALVIKMTATTENGMDTEFWHYFKFNAEGKILAFYALDDGAAWARYDIKPEEPPAELLESLEVGGGEPEAVSDTASANEKAVRKVYELFAAGDIPGIGGLCADPNNGDWRWLGDKGLEKYSGGWNEFTEKALSRIPKLWPTLKVVPMKLIMETDTKVLFKCGATTENGMKTAFYHLWEVNADGKFIAWAGLDDGPAFNKYKDKEEDAAERAKAIADGLNLAAEGAKAEGADGIAAALTLAATGVADGGKDGMGR